MENVGPAMERQQAITGASEWTADPSGGPAALGSGLQWRRVFPGEERQLGLVRRWLESLLPDYPQREDVAVVATELCTNAIQHTLSGRGGWFAVEVTWHNSMVRVAVADGGASGAPQVVNDPEGEHGRGLLIVRGLSARTGVWGDHRGRLVWADIGWSDADTAEPASPQDRSDEVIRHETPKSHSAPRSSRGRSSGTLRNSLAPGGAGYKSCLFSPAEALLITIRVKADKSRGNFAVASMPKASV
jgi:serine/threonine-protein kinase RsbW